jgi:hypothetical protein
MKYLSRTISSIHDYRKGSWTCNAYSIGIDTSDGDNHCAACLNYISLLLNNTNLQFYIILFKVAPHGFNRVQKYKGFKYQKALLSLDHCFDFLTSINDCEYMLTCSKFDPATSPQNIFETQQAVFFLGTKNSYNKLISLIPKLKSIANIENYLIDSGMFIIEDYDTMDIGSTLWFVSNKESTDSLVKIISNL